MSPRRRRVVVAGHDLKFFQPLQRALERTGQFEFRHDLWQGHDRHDPTTSSALRDWAEIVICEWCLGNAVWYSRHLRPMQRLIVRFHLQERDTVHPRLLRLDCVERIVFVGEHIATEVTERLGLPHTKVCIIPNLVEVDRFDLPKRPGAFHRLGLIGMVPERKRLDRAVDLLERLIERDPAYRLHIKGPQPESYRWLWSREHEQRYFTAQRRRLERTAVGRAVVFDPPGDDVPEWLRDIGFVLSPSDFESFHLAVSEGMASGSLPVVWDWDGARLIHGPEYVVRDLEEAARQVEHWRHAPEREAARAAAKSRVRKRFGTDVIAARWRALLEGITDRRARTVVRRRSLVVVHPGLPWPRFPHRELIRALAAELREESVFLVVEPAGHLPSLLRNRRDSIALMRRGALLPLSRFEDNLYFLCRAPSGLRGLWAALQQWLPGRGAGERLSRQIDSLFPGLGGSRLHWITDPVRDLRWLASGARFLYNRIGVARHGTVIPRAAGIEQRERYALQHATATLFSSAADFECWRHLSPKPLWFPDGSLYRACVGSHAVTPLPGGARVGYLGCLADEADQSIIRHAAEALADVSFELLELGPSHPGRPADEAWRSLATLSNIKVFRGLGPAEAARRLAGCNALLLPTSQDPQNAHGLAARLWECCATGRPVVTAATPALRAWEALLYLAEGLDDFPRQIRAAAAEPPGREPRRGALAEQHVWRALVSGRAELIRSLLEPVG